MLYVAGIYTTTGTYPKEPLSTFFIDGSIEKYPFICLKIGNLGHPGFRKLYIKQTDFLRCRNTKDGEAQMFWVADTPLLLENFLRIGEDTGDRRTKTIQKYNIVYVNPGIKWSDFPLFDLNTGKRLMGKTWLPIAIASNMKDKDKLLCVNTDTSQVVQTEFVSSDTQANKVSDMYKLLYTNAIIQGNMAHSRPNLYQVSGGKGLRVRHFGIARNELLCVAPCISTEDDCTFYKVLVKFGIKTNVALANDPSWVPIDTSVAKWGDPYYANIIPYKLSPNKGVVVIDKTKRATEELHSSYAGFSNYKDYSYMTYSGVFMYTGSNQGTTTVDVGALSILGIDASYPKIDNGYLSYYVKPGLCLDLTEVSNFRSKTIPTYTTDVGKGSPMFIRVGTKLNEFPDSDLLIECVSSQSWVGIIPEGTELGKLAEFISALTKGNNSYRRTVVFVRKEQYPIEQLADFLLLLHNKGKHVVLNFYEELLTHELGDYPDSIDEKLFLDSYKSVSCGGITVGVGTNYNAKGLMVYPGSKANKNMHLYYYLELIIIGKMIQNLNEQYHSKSYDTIQLAKQEKNKYEFNEIWINTIKEELFLDLTISTSAVLLSFPPYDLVVAKKTGFATFARRAMLQQRVINTAVNDVMSIYRKTNNTNTMGWLKDFLNEYNCDFFTYQLRTATSLFNKLDSIEDKDSAVQSTIEIKLETYKPSDKVLEYAKVLIDTFTEGAKK